jgi:orotate phosphoribosyltransferase-like protein
LDTELTPTQQSAIALLVGGASQRQVNEQLNLSKNTINNWLQTPTFRLEYARASQLVYSQALHRVAANTCFVIDALLDVVRNTERDSDRIRACTVLLDFASNVNQLTFDARLAALESKGRD